MSGVRLPAVLLLAGLLPFLAGLAACRSNAAGPAAPGGARRAVPGELTPAFQAMRRVLVESTPLREAGAADGLRGRGALVSETGIALLGARMPHDLRRADVARFLEGRAVFGDALKGWARATAEADDEGVLRAFDGVVDAFWGWVDASKGLPPEKSV